jgi:hypothetical protein
MRDAIAAVPDGEYRHEVDFEAVDRARALVRSTEI